MRSQAEQFERYLKVRLEEREAEMQQEAAAALDASALDASQRVQKAVSEAEAAFKEALASDLQTQKDAMLKEHKANLDEQVCTVPIDRM